jgi:hypothetical protein
MKKDFSSLSHSKSSLIKMTGHQKTNEKSGATKTHIQSAKKEEDSINDNPSFFKKEESINKQQTTTTTN